MSITVQERQHYLEHFRQAWPIQRLKALKLEEYTSVGDKNSLVYWLEFGAGRYLGSIKGGDSSKFGIYERKDEPKGQRDFISMDERYSWKNKYGNTAKTAFLVIKKCILRVINSIQAGDITAIEALDFESALKWKLAFIYQDHANPCVLPIYKLSKFKHFLNDQPNYTHAQAYTQLLGQRGNASALEYGFQLWQEADRLEGKMNSEFDDADASTVTEEGLMTTPLNQILYGPPGTGKTYETIRAALCILEPEIVSVYERAIENAKNHKEKSNARKVLKARYDEFVSAGYIRFVTFHQSFSYEDFVEGIRADADIDGKLRYRIDSGIFKRICDDARSDSSQNKEVSQNPSIWKISINGAGDSSSKRYCLEHSEARIGWGETGDLRLDLNNNPYFKTLSDKTQGTLQYFAEQIAVGDILLCLHSQELIGAIGVVTSDYRYEEQSTLSDELNADYQHVRSVKWLYRDIELSVLPLNGGVSFAQQSVYKLDRCNWADILLYLGQNNIKPIESDISRQDLTKPYVLIIDEINRGNISRIMGELITLIETSKREGADEALTVTLPYSKKLFTVPQNVFLIGTMNTADRSLAGLDLALRRRFTFVEMPPKPELLDGLMVVGDDGIDIGQVLRVMNQRITALLDRDHCIGHAYFMPLLDNPRLALLADIFAQNILPLLQEYFFEDWQRIRWVLADQSKPDSLAFIVKDKYMDAQQLFPGVSQFKPRDCWRINTDALLQVEAYQRIYQAGDATVEQAP